MSLLLRGAILYICVTLCLNSSEGQMYDPVQQAYYHLSSNLTTYPDGVPDDVTWIDLQENSFTDINIPYYSNLGSVVLGYNKLMVFPDFNILNRTLAYLDLRKNQITAIPRELLHPLENLHTLILLSNQLTEFLDASDWTGNRLTLLYLGGNPITSVPEEDLSALSNLETLHLSGTGLSLLPDIDLPKIKVILCAWNMMKEFPKFRQPANDLRTLTLHQNELAYIDKNEFKNFPKLEYLSLSHNPFDEEPPPMLDIVKSLPLLTKLEVDGTGLTDIPTHLYQYVPSLETLIIKDNFLTTIPNVCYSSADFTVSVINNNIICDYKLLPVMVGMMMMDVRGLNMFLDDDDGFTCHGPEHLEQTKFRAVTIEQLKQSGSQKKIEFELVDPDVYHCDHPNVTMILSMVSTEDCAAQCLATTYCTSFRYDYDVGTGSSICGITQWFRDEMPGVPTFSEIYVAK